jgi:outer membrane protein assembly factor BamA
VCGFVALAASLSLGDAHGEPCPRVGGSVAAAEAMLQVRQIYVEGADDMSASAILGAIDFHPGDRIPYRRLREAERRLARLGLFVVDPNSDVRPRVVPLQEGDAADVRITVVRKGLGFVNHGR